MAYERAGRSVEGAYQGKQLLANSDDVTTRKVTMLAGAAYVAGAVIGKITASGKYKTSAAAAGDGSETPDLVLAEDVDATGGDREGIAYETATVVSTGLTLGAGHTVA
ncbi:MAG TPA: head decoration protein, partial [Geminicoccaceae bacterium]